MLRNRAWVGRGVSGGLMLLFWGVYLLLQLTPLPQTLAALTSITLAALTFHPLHQHTRNALFTFVTTRKYSKHIYHQMTAPHQRHIDMNGTLSGQTIGGYKLLNQIGRGGFSEVYASQSGGLLLAVKIVDVSQGEEYRMRFDREVGALQLARHPNVVQVFDNGYDGKYAYMVMEYIDGIPLDKYIKDHAPMNISDVVDVVRGLGAAADHMHGQGIVHRDLKPSNIMLYRDSNGRLVPMLLDFGVAKQSAVTVITLDGTVGTVEYMSPEQILEAPMVGVASDVYAMGVITYEMLCGQLPFDGSIGTIVFGHLQDDVPDVRDIIPTIPEHAALALMRAMAKDPQDRFGSVMAFASAVAGLPSQQASVIIE